MATLEFKLKPTHVGARIERLLMELLSCSRSEARALCESGAVRIDGRRVKKGERAAAGAVQLQVQAAGVTPEERLVAQPELALEVRLERQDLVVVRKPAGMPSAPLALGERGTLANALIARYPEMLAFGYSPREPGLVHRLDTQTSGLLLAARDAATFEQLVQALKRGSITKRYLAVVPRAGLNDRDHIVAPLAPGPKGRVIVAGSGTPYRKDAETRLRVIERGPRFALVEVEAPHAFRHQVRVHLAYAGHPIVGDKQYGGEAHALIGARHALHASHLSLESSGNASVPSFSVDDEVPAEFAALLRSEADSTTAAV
ncbi:MAG TPA: RluA family pseudouridine synthase [Polyangiaceae bacterium]|nr:RluA family pseudouridine synthase [Polyangiaceae bacterium]